jgi:hypothetical protein
MRKLNQRLIWVGLSIVTAALSAIYLITRAEIPVSEYANYEYARTAKAVGESKWLPSWLPESAVNIREAHSIDTNQVWLEFRIESLNALTAQGCELVAQPEYKEKLPDVMESLAIKMGRDIATLLAEKDLQLYVCKDKQNLKWGVIFQPKGKSVWSWNSAM